MKRARKHLTNAIQKLVLSPFAKLLSDRCQPNKPHRSHPPYRTRQLLVEILENRVVPATITWLNAAGGDWGTAGNWDLNRTPVDGDDVVIPALTGNPARSAAIRATLRLSSPT